MTEQEIVTTVITVLVVAVGTGLLVAFVGVATLIVRSILKEIAEQQAEEARRRRRMNTSVGTLIKTVKGGYDHSQLNLATAQMRQVVRNGQTLYDEELRSAENDILTITGKENDHR